MGIRIELWGVTTLVKVTRVERGIVLSSRKEVAGACKTYATPGDATRKFDLVYL